MNLIFDKQLSVTLLKDIKIFLYECVLMLIDATLNFNDAKGQIHGETLNGLEKIVRFNSSGFPRPLVYYKLAL